MDNKHIIEIQQPPAPDASRGTEQSSRNQSIELQKFYCFECEAIGFSGIPGRLTAAERLELIRHQHHTWASSCSLTRIVLDPARNRGGAR